MYNAQALIRKANEIIAPYQTKGFKPGETGVKEVDKRPTNGNVQEFTQAAQARLNDFFTEKKEAKRPHLRAVRAPFEDTVPINPDSGKAPSKGYLVGILLGKEA